MRYLVVFEPTDDGFSAYSPDVPGCVATGSTREETEREMRDAIALHLDGLRQDGVAPPDARSSSTYIEVAV